MLFAALMPGWPYGFFTLLRFAVTIASGVIFFWALEREVKWLLWVHAPMAILFNPIVKVYLKRDTWQVIDLIAGVVMLATAVVIHRVTSAPKA